MLFDGGSTAIALQHDWKPHKRVKPPRGKGEATASAVCMALEVPEILPLHPGLNLSIGCTLKSFPL